ncbi:PspC domain-containing protein [Parafrigoribacterium mesophilum]|uniref:ATP-binding protein n=1 Tax=Parafrigoribacterium mesophilum TaxID=433646 RepID=UPI003D15C57F
MVSTPSALSSRPPLVRPRRALVAGVCAGLAEHLRQPVRRVRLLIVVLTFFGGAGALLYLWLWAFTPLASSETDVEPGHRLAVAPILLAGGAIVAVVAVTQANSGRLPYAAIVVATMLTGAAVAWSLAFDRPDPLRSARYGVLVRTFGAGVLIVTGMLLLLSQGARPDALTAVFAVVVIVIGAGVIAAPGVVRLWSDLMTERSARIRQEQRAEIAAHLHDSVLQTLALIQNRAGPSSEVARLARAQERELRDWLFAGTAASGADLATQLREVAAAIELDYPVRMDVVAAGDTAGPSNSTLVAAAREAMLNAARHAGGDVSVYVESSGDAVDVFVRDRGAGVDLDALPADRLGIRESIIGRMSRAGGSGTVAPGAGGVGTEVHLHLDIPQDRGSA